MIPAARSVQAGPKGGHPLPVAAECGQRPGLCLRAEASVSSGAVSRRLASASSARG
jgi:hypothetical protein